MAAAIKLITNIEQIKIIEDLDLQNDDDPGTIGPRSDW
jgi:hypothetical protein